MRTSSVDEMRFGSHAKRSLWFSRRRLSAAHSVPNRMKREDCVNYLFGAQSEFPQRVMLEKGSIESFRPTICQVFKDLKILCRRRQEIRNLLDVRWNHLTSRSF